MTALARVLQQEISLVEAFLQALEREQIALRDIQPQALAEVVASKQRLVEQLNQLASDRAVLCGGATTSTAMVNWLAQHKHEQEAAQLWPQLLEKAREAQRMHSLNGQLINIHLSRTSNALKVLGQTQSAHTLYGSDGQSFGGSGSRIIDAA